MRCADSHNVLQAASRKPQAAIGRGWPGAVTWWCAASGTVWTWTWQPYPGVWVFVLLLAGLYAVAGRRLRQAGDDLPTRRVVAYALGVAALWIVSDWPLGALGAGYLLSVSTARYLVYTLVAPPLIIYGVPAWLLRRLVARGARRHVLRFITRPLVAFAVFNTVMVATHLPPVVDTVKLSQGGSFAMDMVWLASGLVFWWPVLAPLPEWQPLAYPGRILYLILNVFIPTVPASFLTFANYPIYGLYELAPPVGGLTAVDDQQIAGLAMKIVGGFIIFGTGSVLFFRWSREEERDGSGEGVEARPARVR